MEQRKGLRNIAIAAATSAALTFSCAEKDTQEFKSGAIATGADAEVMIATMTPTGPKISTTPESPAALPTIESDFRRTEGEWTDHEIGQLASSMLKEKKYDDIYHAGELLSKILNNTNNFSEINPVFMDAAMTEADLKKFSITTSFKANQLIVDPRINFSGRSIAIEVLNNSNNQQFEVLSVTNLNFYGLELNSYTSNGLSDFAVKFFISSQLKLPEAFKIVSNHLNFFSLPEGEHDQDVQNAKDIYELIYSNYFNNDELVPASHVAAYGAQFLMLPTFAHAFENKEFTPKDLERLGRYRSASDELIKNNVLVKNPDGTYGWTEDETVFMNSLLNFSFEINKNHQSTQTPLRTY